MKNPVSPFLKSLHVIKPNKFTSKPKASHYLNLYNGVNTGCDGFHLLTIHRPTQNANTKEENAHHA